MADKNVSVRIQAVGGDKVKAQFAQIGKTGTASLRSIEKASKSSRFALQNTAFQVQDFFVQVGAGTSPTRSLSQQLPQLLGGFGLIGVLAGTAAAALLPLFAVFVGGAEDAKDLTKTLDDMAKSTDVAMASAKAARVPVDELARQYGELADEISRARQAQAALDQSKAEKDIGLGTRGVARDILGPDLISANALAVAVLGNDLAALISQTEILRDKLAEVIPLSPEETALTKQIAQNQIYIDTLTVVADSVGELAVKYGLTAEEAQRVVAAAIALRDESGVQEQAVAADALLTALTEVFGSVQAVDAALPGVVAGLNQAVTAAGDLSFEMGASADEAARLLRNFRIAQQQIAAAGKMYSGRGGDPRTSNDQGRGRFRYTGPALDVFNNVRTTGRGGGGGISASLREAERLFESTRSAAEKYEAEVANINELHREFGTIVTDEVRDKAIKKLQEDLLKTDSVARQAAGAIRSAFDGIFDDPIAALQNLGEQLIRMALFQQLASSFPSVFGGGGIIPLASFAGGGFTGNGARAGGLDGRGGFMAMLHPQETVTDHTKGGSGGTTVQVINQTGQPTRTQTSQGPDGRDLVRVMVGEEIARGGLDKPMKGRFGAAPFPVKR